MQPSKRALNISLWALRIAFAIVFVWNVQCAVLFVVDPETYARGFGMALSENPYADAATLSAVMGIGVAFLMWNATYPAFIVAPERFKVLGWVIVAQQLIGLVGELYILSIVSFSNNVCSLAIMRFVLFDAIGLLMMGMTFLAFLKLRSSKGKESCQDAAEGLDIHG